MRGLSLAVFLIFSMTVGHSAETNDMEKKLLAHHERIFVMELSKLNAGMATGYNFNRHQIAKNNELIQDPDLKRWVDELNAGIGGRALPAASIQEGVTTIKIDNKYTLVFSPLYMNYGLVFINKKVFNFAQYKTVDARMNAMVSFLNELDQKKVSWKEKIWDILSNKAVAEPLKKHQQILLLSLIQYDIQSSRASDSMFKMISLTRDSPSVREQKMKDNGLVFTAMITGDPKYLRQVSDYSKFKQSTIDKYLSYNWKQFCDNTDNISSDMLYKKYIFGANVGIDTLTWMRMYAVNQQQITTSLNKLLMESGDARDRTSGEKEPLTCEELWSMNTGRALKKEETSLWWIAVSPTLYAIKSHVSADEQKDYDQNVLAARKACKPFKDIVACMERSEGKMGEIVRKAQNESPRNIDATWKDLFVEQDGSFRNTLGK